MTAIHVFICTNTTADIVVPKFARTQEEFNRRVAGGFQAISGGITRAGDLCLRPNANAVPNHLYCNGAVLQIAAFPELFRAIGNSFGGDGLTTFKLPNYSEAALTIAPVAVTQTVSQSGTVSTGATVTTPDQPGETGGSMGGNIISGGRPEREANYNIR